MTIATLLQIASTIFGLCSAALWGYAGYTGLSYDRFKRREARRAQREGRPPNFSAAVFNGKVMGSGSPELLNAICRAVRRACRLIGSCADLDTTDMLLFRRTVSSCN